MTAGVRAFVMVATAALGCRPAIPPPAALDTANEMCGHCRMVVSDQRVAAQLVAPYEEPRFFDDIGCLADYLRDNPTQPSGTVAYVSDHRTASWVPATAAVYVRAPAVATPMGSHLLAFASESSRVADADAATGAVLTARDVFSGGPPGGTP